MFRHILLPTDGSKLSEKSVKLGVGMAKALKARVTVLHVSPKFHAFTYQMDLLQIAPSDYAKACEASARRYLDSAKRTAAAAGVKCDVMHITSDLPFKEIIKTAQKKKCDLIVMASHGRRGIKALVLGSETQKVLTHGKIPVLVSR